MAFSLLFKEGLKGEFLKKATFETKLCCRIEYQTQFLIGCDKYA